LSILDKCEVMRIAFCDGERPYIVPMNFAWMEDDLLGLRLYFHCAQMGRKLDLMRKNPQVCFEVDCSFQLVPHSQACQWSAYHESVIGEGNMEIVLDPEERIQAMDALMHRYGYIGKPQYDVSVFQKTMVLKLNVSQMTGKRNL